VVDNDRFHATNFCSSSADLTTYERGFVLLGRDGQPGLGSVDTDFALIFAFRASPGTAAREAESTALVLNGFVSTSPPRSGSAGPNGAARLCEQHRPHLYLAMILYDLTQNGSVTPVMHSRQRFIGVSNGEIESWNPIGDFGYRGAVGTPRHSNSGAEFPLRRFSLRPNGTPAYVPSWLRQLGWPIRTRYID